MKKIIFIIITLLCTLLQGAWADNYSVNTDDELRAAIADDGANITVTANINLSNSTLVIGSNKTVTIDLGGHTLDRGLTSRDYDHGGQVITVRSGGTLNLSNGTLKGGWGGNGGGIANEGGTATLTGVTITGCVADDRGGGISNGAGGTLTLTGCTITGNTSNDKTAPKGGGGIFNAGTLNMQGTNTINDNTGKDGANNLYLAGSTVINCTGAFDSSTGISVSLENYNRKFTSDYSLYNSHTLPSEFFSCDDSRYVVNQKDGEAFPGVPYWDHEWSGDNTSGHVVSTKKICTDYSYYDGGTGLSDGWYVLSGNHTYEERPRCHGDVKFILLDGCNTEFQKGIHIDNKQHLTIYAQDAGSGKLRCTGDDGSVANGDAAIGGNNEVVGGHLIIHGGTIYAKPSHNNAAGIGGGDGESGMQSITIWDGEIEAYGQDGGAGIGKGYNNAVNFDITIYGGSITANGGDKGAGIGGGQECGTGRIRIFGGTVTANGGKYAAGIGGGNWNQDGNIYIYGGDVTAKGGDGGAGIGAGEYHNGGFIEIHGGTVKAYGGYETSLIGTDVGGAAGIGGGVGKSEVPYYGYGDGGQVDIYGGYVEAYGGGWSRTEEYCGAGAGIGGGNQAYNAGTTNIHGGIVRIVIKARSGNQCIGTGEEGSSYGKNIITLPDNYMVYQEGNEPTSSDNRVAYCKLGLPPLYIMPCNHAYAPHPGKTIINAKIHSIDCGKCLTTTQEHAFSDKAECEICGLIKFDNNNSKNSELIDFWQAESTSPRTVALTGRSFLVDDCWNTVCLPFPVTLEDSPFANTTLKELDTEGTYDEHQTGFDTRNGTLYLYFKDAASIEAGKPYMLKANPDVIINTSDDWNAFANAVNGGNNFSGKVVMLNNDISITNMMVGTSSNRFEGTFSGNGHTLTVNLTSDENYCAPFRYVKNAHIRDLNLAGTITTSRKFAGGLIAEATGYTYIDRCRVSTTVNSSVSGDGTHGGFVAVIQNETTIKDCLFNGKLLGSATNKCGGFVGWVEYDTSHFHDHVFLYNNLFSPEEVTLGLDATFARARSYDWNIRGSLGSCYYTEHSTSKKQGKDAADMTPPELADKLGSNWTVTDGKTVPAMKDYADVISDPVFRNVIINNIHTDVTSEDGKVSFLGNYAPVVLTGGDKSNYYLGSGNKMYWPSKDKTINAFRAYFHVDLEEGEEVHSCRLAFDDEATGIKEVQSSTANGQCSMFNVQWYDLTGRRLSGRPTKSGFYIHGGKKYYVEK